MKGLALIALGMLTLGLYVNAQMRGPTLGWTGGAQPCLPFAGMSIVNLDPASGPGTLTGTPAGVTAYMTGAGGKSWLACPAGFSTNASIQLPDTSATQLFSNINFTVCYWVNVVNTNPLGSAVLVTKSLGGSLRATTNGWSTGFDQAVFGATALAINDNTTGLGHKRCEGYVATNSLPVSAYADGNWHHIAWSVLRSNVCTAALFGCWVDGVRQPVTTSQASTGNTAINISNPGVPFYAGYSGGNLLVASVNIADVRVVPRILTDAEIYAVMNQQPMK